MKCCIECFKDSLIRSTIEMQGIQGNCDFCKAKDVFIYDVNSNPSPIGNMMVDLIQTYVTTNDVDANPLKQALKNDWDIFNTDADGIAELVMKLFPADYLFESKHFSEKATIPELDYEEFLNDFGIVKGLSWSKFADSIKYENRFHSKLFNADAFASVLSIVTEIHPAGIKLFRARIAPDINGFYTTDMSIPPIGKRCAGRINPEGMGILYLASDATTALNEVRANTFDFVTIGEFQLKRDIKIVNLSGLSTTSPFSISDNLAKYAANRKVLLDIVNEIAKPLRRNDSSLDYIPTQFISGFIKSEGFHGVRYASTLHNAGYNIAVFDENLFECVNVKTVEISKISYRTEPKL